MSSADTCAIRSLLHNVTDGRVRHARHRRHGDRGRLSGLHGDSAKGRVSGLRSRWKRIEIWHWIRCGKRRLTTEELHWSTCDGRRHLHRSDRSFRLFGRSGGQCRWRRLKARHLNRSSWGDIREACWLLGLLVKGKGSGACSRERSLGVQEARCGSAIHGRGESRQPRDKLFR